MKENLIEGRVEIRRVVYDVRNLVDLEQDGDGLRVSSHVGRDARGQSFQFEPCWGDWVDEDQPGPADTARKPRKRMNDLVVLGWVREFKALSLTALGARKTLRDIRLGNFSDI